MTENELSRLEALCESVPALCHVAGLLEGPDGAVHAEAEDVNTGDFIAAARAALPDLIAEVRRLREVTEAQASLIDTLKNGGVAMDHLERELTAPPQDSATA